MKEYIINVAQIEELQMTADMKELDKIFDRSKQTIVNGAAVLLVRSTVNGFAEKFDELTTLAALQEYKDGVYKYL